MMTEGEYYDDKLTIIVWYLVLNLVVLVIFLAVLVMMKVKEAEKKTEKDRALVKEGCGHIRFNKSSR